MNETAQIIVPKLSTASKQSPNAAIRTLAAELKSLQQSPLEGFTVKADESDILTWTVGIFGPPGTLYQGGYFKANLRFPANYPYSPPTVMFTGKIWHPNIYESGELCISILHPQIDNHHSDELACERWNPTQNVRTIILSVISLLNEPNIDSPANVDAAISYRRWIESNGKDDKYAAIIKELVKLTRAEAQKDGVAVPETVEEYCVKTLTSSADSEAFELYGVCYDYDDGTEDDAEDSEDADRMEHT